MKYQQFMGVHAAACSLLGCQSTHAGDVTSRMRDDLSNTAIRVLLVCTKNAVLYTQALHIGARKSSTVSTMCRPERAMLGSCARREFPLLRPMHLEPNLR